MPRTRHSQAQSHIAVQIPNVQPILPHMVPLEGQQQPSPVSPCQQTPYDSGILTGGFADFVCDSDLYFDSLQYLLQTPDQPVCNYSEIPEPPLYLPSFQNQFPQQPEPEPQAELQLPTQPQPHLQQFSSSPSSSLLHIGNVTVDQANLHLPPSLSDNERRHRLHQIHQLAADHDNNLPILPEPDLPEFSDIESVDEDDDLQLVSEAVSEEHKTQIGKRNREILALIKDVKRKRNNQSALKTRMTREQKLLFARRMLCENSFELTLLRVKLNALGLSGDTWDMVPAEMRTSTVAKMVELTVDQEKKRDGEIQRRKNKEKKRLKKEMKKRRQEEAERNAAGFF